MNIAVTAGFLLTALLYAMVGFGGGSTYTALLVVADTDFALIPIVSLACNIVVVAGGTLRYLSVGAIRFRRLAPFLLPSVPAAWLGGRMPISEQDFILVLALSLLLAGTQLLIQPERQEVRPRQTPLPLALLTGGAIGFLAGVVGIGGGIFLAPILYALGWGRPREIAAAASLYILVNSVSGLGGQLSRVTPDMHAQILGYWSLPAAVLIGGQIGSWLSVSRLSLEHIRRLTGVLIVLVAARLLWASL